MPEDKVQREIEEILNRLDTFLPEESAATKVRRGSSSAASAFFRALTAPLTHISLRQVMLTALLLIVAGFIAGKVWSDVGNWVLIAGLVLLATGFAASFLGRGGGAPAAEKRWRGEPLVLRPEGPPGLGDRLRTWLRAKRRP